MKRSSTQSIRRGHATAVGLAVAHVAALWSFALSAQTAAPPPVVDALTRGCAGSAGCHRAGAASTVAPDSLESLYAGVIPGFADGSRLYRMAVTRHAGGAAARPHWTAWPSPAEINALRDWIDGLPPAAEAPSAPLPTPGAAATLTLGTDRPSYRSGEIVTLTVATTEPCHLTLVSVDATGAAIVLVPNDFERDNALAAGSPRTIPADPSRYRLRAGKPGHERLIGWCTAEDRPLAGITHRYGTERFTILGDWPTTITGLIEDSIEIETGRSTRRRTRPAGPTGAKPVSLFAPHAYAAVRIAVVPAAEPSGGGFQPALERGEPKPPAGQDGGQSQK